MRIGAWAGVAAITALLLAGGCGGDDDRPRDGATDAAREGGARDAGSDGGCRFSCSDKYDCPNLMCMCGGGHASVQLECTGGCCEDKSCDDVCSEM